MKTQPRTISRPSLKIRSYARPFDPGTPTSCPPSSPQPTPRNADIVPSILLAANSPKQQSQPHIARTILNAVRCSPHTQNVSKRVPREKLCHEPPHLAATEPVDSLPLPLERIDDINRLHSVTLCVVHIRHSVLQDLLQKMRASKP